MDTQRKTSAIVDVPCRPSVASTLPLLLDPPPPSSPPASTAQPKKRKLRETIKRFLPPHPRQWSVQSWVRLSILLGLLVLVLVLFLVVRVDRQIPVMLRWVKDHKVSGAFIYVLLMAAVSVVGVPLSIGAVGAGYVFRPLIVALCVVIAAILLGGTVGFFFGKYLFRGWILKTKFARKSRTFHLLQRAIESEGWKIALLVRLSQLLPFAVANYILAVTPITFFPFIWTTLVGVLPGLIVFTYAGSIVTDLTNIGEAMHHRGKQNITMIICIGCAVVVTLVWITCIARRAWRRAVRRLIIQEQLEAAEKEKSHEMDLDDTAGSGGESPVLPHSILSRDGPVHRESADETGENYVSRAMIQRREVAEPISFLNESLDTSFSTTDEGSISCSVRRRAHSLDAINTQTNLLILDDSTTNIRSAEPVLDSHIYKTMADTQDDVVKDVNHRPVSRFSSLSNTDQSTKHQASPRMEPDADATCIPIGEELDIDHFKEPFMRGEKIAMASVLVVAILVISISLPIIYLR